MYDHYISLGDNCEIGFEFRRIGYEYSNFFRFAFSPFNSTYKLINNNFQDVFSRENIRPHLVNADNTTMIIDKKYEICFHAKIPYIETKEGNFFCIENENFDIAYTREYGKIRYFIDKWDSLVNSNKKVLYFIKSKNQTSRSNAEKLLKLFYTKYPKHDFSIVYLQLSSYYEQDWHIDHLYNRYIPKFAPLDQTHLGDSKAWDKIFSEFPLKN